MTPGWASAHLGYVPEDPENLPGSLLATQSGRPESLSFVAPLPTPLDLLILVRHQPQAELRDRSLRGRRLGAAAMALAEGVFAGKVVGTADTAAT